MSATPRVSMRYTFVCPKCGTRVRTCTSNDEMYGIVTARGMMTDVPGVVELFETQDTEALIRCILDYLPEVAKRAGAQWEVFGMLADPAANGDRFLIAVLPRCPKCYFRVDVRSNRTCTEVPEECELERVRATRWYALPANVREGIVGDVTTYVLRHKGLLAP
jgi:hypothetical protein